MCYFIVMNEPGWTPPCEQEISMRTGTLADLGALALVMERAYAARDNLELPTTANQAGLNEVRTNLTTPSSWNYIASISTEIVGYTIGFPASEAAITVADPETEYLSQLMVDPDFWGRGIATRLLDRVEARARQVGKRHVILWTRQANNSRSQALYERRQYHRTEETKDGYYGPQYQYQLDLY
jgi:ribosomal protein S18 acetylase RimI-like enzyme